jgi:hypothetical protein
LINISLLVYNLVYVLYVTLFKAGFKELKRLVQSNT